MAYSLGNAVSNHFLIGTFELRVGPLSQAGKLTSAQSVGLVEAFNLKSQINTTTLSASYPRRVVDSAVTSALSSFGITLREYSARNLRMLMGEGVSAYTSSDNNVIESGTVSSSVYISSPTINFSSVLPSGAIPLSITLAAEATSDGPEISTTPSTTFTTTHTTKNPNVIVASADFIAGDMHVLTLTIPRKPTSLTFNVTYDTDKFTFATGTGASSFSSNSSLSLLTFVVPKIPTGTASATVKVYLKAKESVTGFFTVSPPKGYHGNVSVAFTRERASLVAGDTVSLVSGTDPANPIITEVVSFHPVTVTTPLIPGLTVRNPGRNIPANTFYTIRKWATNLRRDSRQTQRITNG